VYVSCITVDTGSTAAVPIGGGGNTAIVAAIFVYIYVYVCICMYIPQ